MAMMQELLKRPACAPSDDGYHCADRLRNQFLEYHDPYAWYGEVYTFTKDGYLKNLESRHFLPASSTLYGVRDAYIADIIARLEAGDLSPEELALLYAAAEAVGGKAEEVAQKLRDKENTEEKGQTGTVNTFDQLAAGPEFKALVDALREAASPLGPNALASAVGATGALPGHALVALRDAGAMGDLTPVGVPRPSPTGAWSQTYLDEYGDEYTLFWHDTTEGTTFEAAPAPPKMLARPPEDPDGVNKPGTSTTNFRSAPGAAKKDFLADTYDPFLAALRDSPPAHDDTYDIFEQTTSPAPTADSRSMESMLDETAGALKGLLTGIWDFYKNPSEHLQRDDVPHAAPHSADVPLPAAESRTFLDKLLVDAGHVAQLGAHAIGEDAAEIYGTAWDFAAEHVLPQQRNDGPVSKPKPSRLRNVFSSGVGRLAEMGSLALADAATFGLASQGPLREQFEQIADTNLHSGTSIDLDAVTGTAKDIVHVFDPFEQFRVAVRDAGRAADREDDKELGERMVDAIAAALAAIELGRTVVEPRPPRAVTPHVEPVTPQGIRAEAFVEPPPQQGVQGSRAQPAVTPQAVRPEAQVGRAPTQGAQVPHAEPAVTPQAVNAEDQVGRTSTRGAQEHVEPAVTPQAVNAEKQVGGSSRRGAQPQANSAVTPQGVDAEGSSGSGSRRPQDSFGTSEGPPTLPPYSGGKTSGVFRSAAGDIPLLSGYDGPSAAMPKGTPGMNGRIKSHVEAHAASIMRQQGLTEGTLYINRVPCPGTTGCAAMLPSMLPEGARLRVIGPGGYDRTFIGLRDR